MAGGRQTKRITVGAPGRQITIELVTLPSLEAMKGAKRVIKLVGPVTDCIRQALSNEGNLPSTLLVESIFGNLDDSDLQWMLDTFPAYAARFQPITESNTVRVPAEGYGIKLDIFDGNPGAMFEFLALSIQHNYSDFLADVARFVARLVTEAVGGKTADKKSAE